MESCVKSNEESKRKKVAGKQASIGSFSLIIIYFCLLSTCEKVVKRVVVVCV